MRWEYSEVETSENQYGAELPMALHTAGENGWEAYAVSFYGDHNNVRVRVYHLKRPSVLTGGGDT